jgi:CheY-like chemotaxis protein
MLSPFVAGCGEMLGRERAIVVYADDDELVRETIALGLAAEGWRVHTCSDGEQAIILCEKFRPLAVLLDLDMSHVSGFEAAHRIRHVAGCHPARLVALTGRATAGVRSRALSSGFDAVLYKPVSTPTLSSALVP